MTQRNDQIAPSNPLARVAREAAARHPDPSEAESLLRSAKKIENIERKLFEARASLVEAVERSKAEVDALRRRNHLPTWVVVLVLSLLAVFLVFVAIKHHV